MIPTKVLLFAFITAGLSLGCNHKSDRLQEVITGSLDAAVKQYMALAYTLENEPDQLPRSYSREGKLITCNSGWWVSGFFPGSLWYLYEYSGDNELKKMAEEYTKRVEDQQYTTNTHDVGFMIYCSFGNRFRVSADRTVLLVSTISASSALSTI